MKKHNKVVLAYSGGLDTSFCIPYLLEQNYKVQCILVNTGGFSPSEIKSIEEKAFALGATAFEIRNVQEKYYEHCIRYLVYGNVLRNDIYPICVSSERIFQAMEVAQFANKVEAQAIAHGSTGAGNDQVRFDLVFNAMCPQCDIITPIRDKQLSREEEIAYLKSKGFEWFEERGKYSINKGLWGTSIGGVETLHSRHPIPDSVYPSQVTVTNMSELSITFRKGVIAAVNGEEDTGVNLIMKLNEIGAKYAIGRGIHVGDTIIGIKGRVAFEAPAAYMIIHAHKLLEKHTLSKWQLHWNKQLGDWYGMLAHEGQFLEPVMRNIETFLTDSQKCVNGTVFLSLHPYRFELQGVESENDLMETPFGKYGEEQSGWTAEEAKGFIKIMGNASKIYAYKNNVIHD